MKCFELRTRFLSTVLLLLGLLAPCPMARGFDNFWIGPDLGNWNTGANWEHQDDPNLHEVPDVFFDEEAVIDNGATALLNAPAMNAMSNGDVGGVRLGSTMSGGLRIQSGGVLRSLAGATETGAITVGAGSGTGTLTILGNGMLSGTSLSLAGASASSISLSDTASLSVTGTANLQRTTTISGQSVNFNATGNLTLGNSSILVADIRSGTTHSALKTDATANVNGTVKPMFTGVTPALGSKWTLIDAATAINGSFSNLDLSMAAALPAGQTYQIVSETAGARQLLRLTVAEILTLQVDRVSGAVSIANLGAQSKSIDGYSILSSLGSLTGAWNSLDDQNIGGANAWVEAAPTPTDLNELNPQGSSALAGSASFNLGTPYVKTFPEFGTDPDDISFEYTTPDGRTIQGSVAYTGAKTHNNFVLNVDPTTGQVAFRNDSPFSVQIDGYAIYSDSGSLVPATWNSLEDQNVADWEQAPPVPTATAVAELKADDATAFQGQTGFSLGALFKTVGATQDLRFEFLMPGEEVPSIGTVVYGPFTAPVNPSEGLDGDYNMDGRVDAADYVVWRKNDGSPAGYNTWRQNFGRTLGAGSGSAIGAAAVPEPATIGLLVLAAFTLAAKRGNRRGRRAMAFG